MEPIYEYKNGQFFPVKAQVVGEELKKIYTIMVN